MTLGRFLKGGRKGFSIILIIYILAFLGATSTHVCDIIRYGFFGYSRINPDIPAWQNVFWTMLTVIDPLAILVLLLNVRAGLVTYLAVIAADVAVNASFLWGNYGLSACFCFSMISQFLFLVFVLLTIIPLGREAGRIEGGKRK